jgi:hypothetical protein
MKPIDISAWDKQRERAILAALQAGRPVFADSEGVLRYFDGACEPVVADAGPSKTTLATIQRPWWCRVWLWMGGGS